jgi:hypothetical protein
MSSVEINGLDEIMQKLDETLESFPEKRKSFHDKSGKLILTKVKKNTPYDADREAKAILGSKSHLRDGIYVKVGDKGGYAAVRADYSGKVTGHAVPHAHLVEKGHVQNTKNGEKFVKGKHMFENGLKESEAELLSMAEEFADEIAGDMT